MWRGHEGFLVDSSNFLYSQAVKNVVNYWFAVFEDDAIEFFDRYQWDAIPNIDNVGAKFPKKNMQNIFLLPFVIYFLATLHYAVSHEKCPGSVVLSPGST